jgi:deoxycytidylate deaminase
VANDVRDYIKDLTAFDCADSELVFGFVSPVGTDLAPIISELKRQLRTYKYEANDVHLSDFLTRYRYKLENKPEYRRIETRMDAARDACEKMKRCDLMALAAVNAIARKRAVDGSTNPPSTKPLGRVAHLLTSLKRPDEVSTLRKIYGPGFYLIGIFATEEERLQRLITQNTPKDKAEGLIERDQNEDHPFGQKTRRTFHLSDVFLRTTSFKEELERFLKLVFCNPYITPTAEERAMFFAYAAGTRSGQLGRQVGACITSPDLEDILAVGCNDVPKVGGGLYWPGPGDQRDNVLGYDTNDRELDFISQKVFDRVKPHIPEKNRQNLPKPRALFKDALDITEFGRAVHAEMDALLSSARLGISPRNAILFTTTFPCHNCTRHIIASGISEVYYIEPYIKSRAKLLHGEEITIEETEKSDEKKVKQSTRGRFKVLFRSFTGIGPRRFIDLFSVSLGDGYELERKVNSKTIEWRAGNAIPRISMRPHSYLQRELLAAHLISK